MTVPVKVHGLKELDEALGLLPKAFAKAALRELGKKALVPVQEAAQGYAPDDPETPTANLRESIVIGTKLTKRQAGARRSMMRETGESKSFVEVFVGTKHIAGVPQEFGTVNHAAQPFMRPAWDENQDRVLDIIRDEWEDVLIKHAKRLARKVLRAAGKGRRR